ncbi:DUF4920 domain-containing protein [Paraglaciecola aestuariivivens]
MRVILFFLLFFASHACLNAQVIRLSDPIAADHKSETFGAHFNAQLPSVSLDTLSQSPEQYLGKTFKMQTRIAKVCKKKGCFFIAQQNQHVIRVAFRDYGFFIPTDSSDKTVELTGELVKKQRTEAQSQHYQQDLTEKLSALPIGEVYEIVADSIKIPLSVSQ